MLWVISTLRSATSFTSLTQASNVRLASWKRCIESLKNNLFESYIDYTWVYLVKNKSEFNRVLKEFIAMIEAQNHRIESFHCDNVKKNINVVIIALLKKRIQWEITISYNSHQNDVIERRFRTIFNRVRVCLIDFKLSWYLRDEICHVVIDLKNINSCTSFERIQSQIWVTLTHSTLYDTTIERTLLSLRIKKSNVDFWDTKSWINIVHETLLSNKYVSSMWASTSILRCQKLKERTTISITSRWISCLIVLNLSKFSYRLIRHLLNLKLRSTWC